MMQYCNFYSQHISSLIGEVFSAVDILDSTNVV